MATQYSPITGTDLSTIDAEAADYFLKDIKQATIEQIRTVRERLARFATDDSHYGTRPTHQGRKIDVPTVQEIRLRMAHELQERGAGCLLCAFGQWDKTDACEHA